MQGKVKNPMVILIQDGCLIRVTYDERKQAYVESDGRSWRHVFGKPVPGYGPVRESYFIPYEPSIS